MLLTIHLCPFYLWKDSKLLPKVNLQYFSLVYQMLLCAAWFIELHCITVHIYCNRWHWIGSLCTVYILLSRRIIQNRNNTKFIISYDLIAEACSAYQLYMRKIRLFNLMQVQQIQWRQECLEISRSGIIRLQHYHLFYLFRLIGAVV